jgi:hypothetical protein
MIRKMIVSIVFVFSISAFSVFAEPGWIGSGEATSGSNPKIATVKWVKQDITGWTKFKINEFSSGLPADRIWKFDGNTSVGKTWLAILLAAKSGEQQIQFYEIENYAQEGTICFWKVDAITLGENN